MSRLPVIECDNLISCPRCGGEAVIQQCWVKGHANLKHYKPVCKLCNFNYRDEYKSLQKAISVWNNSDVNNNIDIKMYKSMNKDELIKLIVNNELIPIEQINPDNKYIIDHFKSNGYSIVPISFVEECHKESLDLARYRFMEYERQKALHNERGYALWEENV